MQASLCGISYDCTFQEFIIVDVMANNDPLGLLKLLYDVYAIKLEIIIILITFLYNNYPKPGVCKARTYTLDL